MMVGCSISLNKAELQDICLSQNHTFLSRRRTTTEYIYIPKWLVNDVAYIGIYGNADPYQENHWIPIHSKIDDSDFNVKSRKWLPSQSKCDGLVTNLNLNILWSYSGRTNNPQAKIISATKEYNEGYALTHTVKSPQKQAFQFSATVSWTFVKPEQNVAKKPIPTLFTVPNDVFYPFQMSSSSIISTKFMLQAFIAFISYLIS